MENTTVEETKTVTLEIAQIPSEADTPVAHRRETDEPDRLKGAIPESRAVQVAPKPAEGDLAESAQSPTSDAREGDNALPAKTPKTPIVPGEIAPAA